MAKFEGMLANGIQWMITAAVELRKLGEDEEAMRLRDASVDLVQMVAIINNSKDKVDNYQKTKMRIGFWALDNYYTWLAVHDTLVYHGIRIDIDGFLPKDYMVDLAKEAGC